jgi:hypothetical protein
MRSLISILVTYLHSLVSILIELNNLASSLKPQASSKEALSKVLKPSSSTLEVYKERSFIGTSLNAS